MVSYGTGTGTGTGVRVTATPTDIWKQLPPGKQTGLITGTGSKVTTTRPRFSMGGLFGSMGFDMLLGRPLGETVAGNALASTELCLAATLAGAWLQFQR